MARTQLSSNSPRVVKKAFREELKQRNMSYRQGIEARKQAELEKNKRLFPVGNTRRNPGRMDGVQWNGQAFVSPRQVDGESSEDSDLHEEIYAYEDDSHTDSKSVESQHVISIWDIAKPAKPRGVNKEYEVVKGVKQVIALDDDSFATDSEDWRQALELMEDEDDWESLFSEAGDIPESRNLYSDIVRARTGAVGDG